MLDWLLSENMIRSHGFDACVSALGAIPHFVRADDPRPLHEQINERYIGGWNSALPGKWQLLADSYLRYPGDPLLAPIASATHGRERIIVYPHAWVVIEQADGQFALARID